MVDGVAGEAIQLAPKTAEQGVKQNIEHVLIPLQMMVELIVLDQRLLQGTAILTLVVCILSKPFFYLISIEIRAPLKNASLLIFNDSVLENRLIIVGGCYSYQHRCFSVHDREFLSSVEALDENNHLSCNIPSFPIAVKRHSSTVTSSGILVCGDETRFCYEYRKGTNSWVKMTWMPATRTSSDMIYLKGRVWAVGGSSSRPQSTMEIFDYNTTTWTRQWIPFNAQYTCLTKLSPNQFILTGGYQNIHDNEGVSKT